jgi:hypothetical protein
MGPKPASEKQGFQIPHITRVEPSEGGFVGVCSCGGWKPETFKNRALAVAAAFTHRMANK